MLSIRSMVLKGVQKHNIMAVLTDGAFFELLRLIYVIVYQRFYPFSVFCVFCYHIKNFNFIIGGFKVVFGTFLNFQCDICIV